MGLDSRLSFAFAFFSSYIYIYIYIFFFFFSAACVLEGDKIHCSCTVHGTHGHFIKKIYIKNGFHGTIHIFKNYFTTMFSVFGFQFSVSAKISCIQTDYWYFALLNLLDTMIKKLKWIHDTKLAHN